VRCITTCAQLIALRGVWYCNFHVFPLTAEQREEQAFCAGLGMDLHSRYNECDDARSPSSGKNDRASRVSRAHDCQPRMKPNMQRQHWPRLAQKGSSVKGCRQPDLEYARGCRVGWYLRSWLSFNELDDLHARQEEIEAFGNFSGTDDLAILGRGW
jgi:hypothetical protein